MNPFRLFENYYASEIALNHLEIPSACYLSTIGLDGFPNARFVSFKELNENKFILTGPLNSRKGKEIADNNKVALTFWWPYTLKQVRIQGGAYKISDEKASYYFDSRDYDSKVVSTFCIQGRSNSSIDALKQLCNYTMAKKVEDLKRPHDWGGFSIEADRMEFMNFKKNRFHERIVFIRVQGGWREEIIEP